MYENHKGQNSCGAALKRVQECTILSFPEKVYVQGLVLTLAYQVNAISVCVITASHEAVGIHKQNGQDFLQMEKRKQEKSIVYRKTMK